MNSAADKKTLWTIKEAAEQLSLSTRTIERMVSANQIPFIKIGRLIRIPVEEAKGWVAEKLSKGDNTTHARRDVHKKNGGSSTCQSVKQMVCSSEVTRNFGGSVMLTDAASELAEALKLSIEKKQKHS
jgi:excisionase family DNA binding protein